MSATGFERWRPALAPRAEAVFATFDAPGAAAVVAEALRIDSARPAAGNLPWLKQGGGAMIGSAA